MRYFALVAAVFAASVVADGHDYCACQVSTDQGVAESPTQRVLDNYPNTYAWAQEAGGIWYGHSEGPGPRFAGAFLARLGGGKIDGDTFYNACYLYGGNDATCFDCSDFQTMGASGKDRLCVRS